MLQSKEDHYGGVIVDASTLPTDAAEFLKQLKESLDEWNEKGKRGIWLTIPIKLAALVPIATEHGFTFHHTEPDSVTLTRWLPKNEPCQLPDFASHTIGVGGFVLDEQNRLLVVCERFLGGFPKHLKLPGGYVQPGEDLPEAVVREVKEETGVDAEFQSVVCWRHLFPHNFGRSDMYFVCLCKAKSSNIVIDHSEISECQWMHIDDYLANPNLYGMNARVAQIVKESLGIGAALPAPLPDCKQRRQGVWVERCDIASLRKTKFSSFYTTFPSTDVKPYPAPQQQ